MLMAGRAVFSILTLYMMVILVRWFAPYLEIDLYAGRMRWVSSIVDPVVRPIRRVLPPMGPMDLAPAAALFVVWLVREVVVAALMARYR